MKDYIKELEQRIADELKVIDREAAFDAMLDECYDFSKVGGPFENMQPSDVLKECDPTAYRCGVNDYADGEDWTEVDGETYDASECDGIKETLVSELESEIKEKQQQIDDERDDDEPIMEFIMQWEDEREELQAGLAALQKHSF